MSRAIRRAHDERLKARARKILIARERVPDAAWVGKLAGTPCPCSCPACGNQREIHGPTRQERISGND